MLLLPVSLLLSCKHQDPVAPVVVAPFIPPNNCQTQLIGVRDSLFANTVDHSQVLDISYVNRANGATQSMFGQDIGVLDNYDHQGLVIGGMYYFLIRSNSAPGSLLQSVNLSTELSESIYIPNLYLSYLIYDSASQTFFARSHYTDFDSLASFQLSGKAVINYRNIIAVNANTISTTIDPLTRDIYILGGNGTQLSVYRNNVLQNISLSDNSSSVMGIRFNINDHCLYALQGSNIVKINTSTGVITKLCSEPYQLSTGIFGAVMDQCNNQFIISGVMASSADTGVFIVYDNSVGKLASTATAMYCYMALSVK